jgi:hypothetical protein
MFAGPVQPKRLNKCIADIRLPGAGGNARAVCGGNQPIETDVCELRQNIRSISSPKNVVGGAYTNIGFSE